MEFEFDFDFESAEILTDASKFEKWKQIVTKFEWKLRNQEKQSQTC